jgi:hypothetical protein
MQNKKVAAALAAVQLYLQQEADEAAAAAAALSQAATTPGDNEPGQWALAGRLDMMSARRMMQMRAFAR